MIEAVRDGHTDRVPGIEYHAVRLGMQDTHAKDLDVTLRHVAGNSTSASVVSDGSHGPVLISVSGRSTRGGDGFRDIKSGDDTDEELIVDEDHGCRLIVQSASSASAAETRAAAAV